MQHGFGVAQVDVDAVVVRDDFGDSAGGRREDLVGLHKALLEPEVAVDFAEFVVVDDNQRIDVLAEALDALLGLAKAHVAFKSKRSGDDANGEDSEFARGFGDDRGGSRTGSATHARGDEHHFGLGSEGGLNLSVALEGGLLADFGVRAGTEAFGEGRTKLDFGLHRAVGEGLAVGVADDEIHPANALVLHVVDGVRAAAAYAYNLDRRRAVLG